MCTIHGVESVNNVPGHIKDIKFSSFEVRKCIRTIVYNIFIFSGQPLPFLPEGLKVFE